MMVLSDIIGLQRSSFQHYNIVNQWFLHSWKLTRKNTWNCMYCRTRNA